MLLWQMRLLLISVPLSICASGFSAFAEPLIKASDLSELGMDMPTMMNNAEEIAQGNHRFTAKEKLWTYEHSQGRTPDKARALFQKGLDEQFAHHQDQAMKLYDHAIGLAPKYLPIQFEKAALLADMHKQPESIEMCTHMLNAAPDYEPALQLRACCYGETNKFKEAIADWTAMTKLNGRNPVPYAQRAQIYKRIGKTSEAKRFDTADELSLPAKLGLLVANNQTEQALKLADDGVKRHPDDLQLKSARLTLEFESGKYKRFLEDSAPLMKSNVPTRGMLCDLRGKAFMKLDMPDKAVDEFTTAIAMQETAFNKQKKGSFRDKAQSMNFIPYLNRARAYLAAKKYPEAVADCNIALKFNPKAREAMAVRGKAKQAQGKLKEALADFKKASAEESGNGMLIDELEKDGDLDKKLNARK